jgi:hypothetical protein
MIAPEIEKRADEFANRWNEHISSLKHLACNELKLDYSWPSVSICDHFAVSLIRKKEFSSTEQEFFSLICSYLGIFIYRCWSQVHAKVELKFIDQNIVLIAGADAGYSPENSCTISITDELAKLINSPPEEFNLGGDLSRFIYAEDSLISLFTYAVATGISPLISQSAENQSSNLNQENIDKIISYLGSTTVRRYEELYPEELIGQIGELYLHDLISPPEFTLSNLPAVSSVHGIISAKNEFKIPLEKLKQFGNNLLYSPAEKFNYLGFLLATVIRTELNKVDSKVRTVGENFITGLLRHSYYDLKIALFNSEVAEKRIGVGEDWLFAEKHHPSHEAEMLYELDCGYLPLLSIPPTILKTILKERFINKHYQALLEGIILFDCEQAIAAADAILDEHPGRIEIALQKLFIELSPFYSLKDYSSLEARFRSLVSEPRAEVEPLLFSLWGNVKLAEGDLDNALTNYKKAYSLANYSSRYWIKAATDYAWALTLTGQADEAEQIFDHIFKDDRKTISSTIHHILTLNSLGKDPSIQLDYCLKLAPLDKRVFTLAFLTPRSDPS